MPDSYNYFNFPSASPIRFHAFSIFAMLLAKEKRMQFGSPNASPITEETWAIFSKYMQRSFAFRILFSPSDLPK